MVCGIEWGVKEMVRVVGGEVPVCVDGVDVRVVVGVVVVVVDDGRCSVKDVEDGNRRMIEIVDAATIRRKKNREVNDESMGALFRRTDPLDS